MILNTPKTKSLIVTEKGLKNKLSDGTLNINVNGGVIEQVCVHKLLGLKFDEQLSFNEHIEDLCRKLSQRIGVLNKIKRNLPINERKLFYNALIKPIMLYGSCVWSSTSCENINRIYKLQKRAARVILNTDRHERSTNLFEQLNWLPLKDEIIMQKSCLLYKCMRGEARNYLRQLLVKNSGLHTRKTRHAEYGLVCPRYNRETEGGRTFHISSVKLWNSIPIDIHKKETIGDLKNSLRKHLLDSEIVSGYF